MPNSVSFSLKQPKIGEFYETKNKKERKFPFFFVSFNKTLIMLVEIMRM